MENKSSANKWLIAAVIVMGIVIVAMATWMIVSALNSKDKSSDASVKTSQTRKDAPGLSDRTRDEGSSLSDSSSRKYQDFRTGQDGTVTRLTSASDVDKLDIDTSLKIFLKSKVGQPIPERAGYTYEPIIDRAYGKYAAVYGLTNAYTIIGPKDGTGEIAIVAGTQQGAMSCSDLRAAKVPSRLVDGKCDTSGSSQSYDQE